MEVEIDLKNSGRDTPVKVGLESYELSHQATSVMVKVGNLRSIYVNHDNRLGWIGNREENRAYRTRPQRPLAIQNPFAQ